MTAAPTEIKEGLEFILSHLTGPQFPRTIMTPKTKQKQVNSKEEALYFFERSQFTDCRINSFYFSYLDFGLSWKPDILFIDLDLENFYSRMGLDSALSKTLSNIQLFLKDKTATPTVLWSGRGYHVIQPLDFPKALEYVPDFDDYDKPSEQFLRFCKDFLSDNNADKGNFPGFRSCLLRVPNTINSKNGSTGKVKILQKWNGKRQRVPKSLVLEFLNQLKRNEIDQLIIRCSIEQQNRKQNPNNNFDSKYYEWIDKLLETGIEDCRKLVTDLILSRYLVKVKGLSFEESFNLIKQWLDKCDKIRKLDSNFTYRINLAIKYAHSKQYGPMSREKIKSNHSNLYSILVNNQNMKEFF